MNDPRTRFGLWVALLCSALWAGAAGAAPPRPELLQDPAFRERARQVYAGHRAARRLARTAAAAAATKNVITRGTLRPLVLLVDFPDRPHNPTGHEPIDYSGILFADNGPALPSTVREYFTEVSYGALQIEGDASSIYGWKTLPKDLAYYVGSDQGFTRGSEFVADAVAAFDGVVDFSAFDSDHDGVVDALIVVHAGWGWEDSGGAGVTDWSGTTATQDIASQYNTISLTTNDPAAGGGTIRIADYMLVPEESYKLDLVWNGGPLVPDPAHPGLLREVAVDDGDEPLVEIGVLCHELGHLLGLPDLYDTTFQSLGVGNYCLMGYGMWGANYPQAIENNRIKNSPVHLSPWAKKKLGWLEPTPVWTDGVPFYLRWVETYPEARVLYADSQAGEYFLLEHRASVGFDSALAGYGQGGLLLWHVDERVLAAGGGTPNDDWTHKGVDVVCANGLDAFGRDDLDNGIAYASPAHWYADPLTLSPFIDSLPGPADSRTNLGRVTGISLTDLSPLSTEDAPWMTGTASAGTVVLDPRSFGAAPADHALALAWSPSLSGDVAGYRLHFAQGADTETSVDVGDATATAYRLSGLGEATLYRLRLAAYDAGGNESDGVEVQASTLDTIAPTAIAAPAGGLSNAPVRVTLSASEPAAIYYTLDGSDPTASSPTYGQRVLVATTATLTFQAVDGAGNRSPVYAERYIIDTVAPTAAASPTTCLSRVPVEVTLTKSEAGSLFYTLDGTDPTTGSTPYTAPLTVDQTRTLKFLAVDEAGNRSPVYAETYTIDTTAPTTTATPPSRTFSAPFYVALSSSEPATIRYTLDGSEPGGSSPAYSAPIPVEATTTLKFFGVDEAGNPGGVVTEQYTYQKSSGGGGGGGGGCFVEVARTGWAPVPWAALAGSAALLLFLHRRSLGRDRAP